MQELDSFRTTTKTTWNHKTLAFLQSSFPPQVPVKHHAPVCRPFTLNTHTHAWEHPYQRRWKPGTPRAGWRAAWGMDSPAQMCSVLPQAESVFVLLAAYIHITSGPVWLLQTGSGVCRFHMSYGLCTDGKKSLAHHKHLLCQFFFHW